MNTISKGTVLYVLEPKAARYLCKQQQHELYTVIVQAILVLLAPRHLYTRDVVPVNDHSPSGIPVPSLLPPWRVLQPGKLVLCVMFYPTTTSRWSVVQYVRECVLLWRVLCYIAI